MDRYLSWLIEAVLDRVGGLQVRDMHTILNLGGGYKVTRMEVDPESWLAGETLRTINLPAEGLIVLAIERPDGTTDYGAGGGRLCAARRVSHRVWTGGPNPAPLRSAPVRL